MFNSKDVKGAIILRLERLEKLRDVRLKQIAPTAAGFSDFSPKISDAFEVVEGDHHVLALHRRVSAERS